MAARTHRWSTRVLPSGRVVWSCSQCDVQAETPKPEVSAGLIAEHRRLSAIGGIA